MRADPREKTNFAPVDGECPSHCACSRKKTAQCETHTESTYIACKVICVHSSRAVSNATQRQYQSNLTSESMPRMHNHQQEVGTNQTHVAAKLARHRDVTIPASMKRRDNPNFIAGKKPCSTLPKLAELLLWRYHGANPSTLRRSRRAPWVRGRAAVSFAWYRLWGRKVPTHSCSLTKQG